MKPPPAIIGTFLAGTLLAAALLQCSPALGDVLELKDGTVYEDCYVRDEGVRLVIWESLDKVGTTACRIVPRSQLAPRLSKEVVEALVEKGKPRGDRNPRIERGEDWDAKPQLPDLSVTFIEVNPKLAGLHGRVQYEGKTNAPWVGGAPVLDKRVKELEAQGKDRYLHPEYIVQDLKLKYEPGEELTLTAHVRNFGFVAAEPFQYRWLIDNREVERSSYDEALEEMGEATFEYKYAWQEGSHTVTFQVGTEQQEIATINNTARDALWAFPYFYAVSRGRVDAWHQNRTAYGTFSFEDFYRWHLDIMNLLFRASVFPSAPRGIKARVRLDKIYYLDAVDGEAVNKVRIADDGIGYDQGGWIWNDSEKERETGVWSQTDKTWRNQTEWSLPHELGHQLGLVDYYALDYAGHEHHTWPDNGEKIAHFQNHPIAMMHWHGPQPFNEVSAMYLNMTCDKPRGYFGDHYFAMPDENFLRIVDVNGRGVSRALVQIYQRGAEVDPDAKPRLEHGAVWYPLIEDGNFGKPVSKDPVIVGTTDTEGLMRLPNRAVKEVKTLNGYHRKPNPFGNINVVGGRGLMLVKVVKNGPPAYFWLEAVDFNLAWYNEATRSKFTVVLKTPFGSADSPKPPVHVTWQYTDATKKFVRVTWGAPRVRERNYLERATAYRVYRRHGPMGLNDRPWFPVATLNADAREFTIDLATMMVNDIGWFTNTDRFAVSTLGELSIESELVQARQVEPRE